MRFSIILPSYKEPNINKTIELLLGQSLSANMKLNKIFVIACGYDDFPFIKDKKIKILDEKRRMGKAHAINLALKKVNSETKSDIVVLQSADTLPRKAMLKNLLKPFSDSRVGMTTCRPISMDDPKEFIGFLNNLVWSLHHFVSLENPKVGEALAFKNIIKKIPKKLATDEAYIESAVRKSGYRVVYVPSAVVLNTGPQNISDFINQRKRIFIGHTHIKNKYGYKVSTMDVKIIMNAFFKYLKTRPIKNCKQAVWILCAALLEIHARLLGLVDFYITKKVPYIWMPIKKEKSRIVGHEVSEIISGESD